MAVYVLQRVVGNAAHLEIKYQQDNPPVIFFDTNVWRSLNDTDISLLQHLQQKCGFRYRYSVTNFVELISHLEDQPSECSRNPFRMYRACFRRMGEICEREILPSPEVMFLTRASLIDYIDPVWIPSIDQMALAVDLIRNAESLAVLTGEDDGNSETTNKPRYIVKPSHYRKLRSIDRDSMRDIMEELQDFRRPISLGDHDKLLQWFMRLSEFFLFVRPTSAKRFLKDLTKQEQDRFWSALIGGVGQLFQTHCIHLVKKTVNDGRKVDPNDLYDMLQLILLDDDNSLFVTRENIFFLYQIDPNQPQRVLHWDWFTSGL